MEPFRYVKITDVDNTTSIELNDFDGYLMTSPSGFGIYRTAEYVTIGNQRVMVANSNSFNKITFNIDIFGTRTEQEQKYAELRDFISNNIDNGFRLYYRPLDNTRYVECDILIVGKTEKALGYLPISLEIQPKTLWLQDVQKTSVAVSTDSNVNQFILPASFLENANGYYTIAFGRSDVSVALLENAGIDTTPMVIRIYGHAVNPLLTLIEYGKSEAVQVVGFNDLEIPAGYYLEINSNPKNAYVHLVEEKTGYRIDRESFVNLETNVYMRLPKGKWNLLVEEESQEGKCFIEVFFSNQYYGG